MDKQSIFRRESLDRVESPEQLDAYIKVSHPKVWLIMAALLVAVISVIVWSVVGSLPQTARIFCQQPGQRDCGAADNART